MTERSVFRILIGFVALAACLIAGFSFGYALPKDDGLEPLPAMDYRNTYETEEFVIACKHQGSRTDFKDDGSDIAPGDRIVRDCTVEPLP